MGYISTFCSGIDSTAQNYKSNEGFPTPKSEPFFNIDDADKELHHKRLHPIYMILPLGECQVGTSYFCRGRILV